MFAHVVKREKWRGEREIQTGRRRHRQRDRETERQKDGERESERKTSVCVVRVYV